MIYTKEQNEDITKGCVGKTIESLKHDEVDACWIMKFTDTSEIRFRFISE